MGCRIGTLIEIGSPAGAGGRAVLESMAGLDGAPRDALTR